MKTKHASLLGRRKTLALAGSTGAYVLFGNLGCGDDAGLDGIGGGSTGPGGPGSSSTGTGSGPGSSSASTAGTGSGGQGGEVAGCPGHNCPGIVECHARRCELVHRSNLFGLQCDPCHLAHPSSCLDSELILRGGSDPGADRPHQCPQPYYDQGCCKNITPSHH